MDFICDFISHTNKEECAINNGISIVILSCIFTFTKIHCQEYEENRTYRTNGLHCDWLAAD